MNHFYEIEAGNIQGARAPEFINKRFTSMSDALWSFDAMYARKGFKITIVKYVLMQNDGYWINEPVSQKIIKSTYR